MLFTTNRETNRRATKHFCRQPVAESKVPRNTVRRRPIFCTMHLRHRNRRRAASGVYVTGFSGGGGVRRRSSGALDVARCIVRVPRESGSTPRRTDGRTDGPPASRGARAVVVYGRATTLVRRLVTVAGRVIYAVVSVYEYSCPSRRSARARATRCSFCGRLNWLYPSAFERALMHLIVSHVV